MTAPFLTLAAELKAKDALDAGDFAALRNGAWTDGTIDPMEAEAIFDLNSELAVRDRDWVDFFVEAMSAYIVEQTAPRGFVDDAKAGWLIARIDRDGRIDTLGELELLVNVLERATTVPESLKSYALAEIEAIALTGHGPTRDGGALDPGCINAAEARLLRRVLFAQAGDGPAYISRAEAELLFRLKDTTIAAANAAEWRALFVQGVANHLMAHNSYRPLGTSEAARLEAFMDDNRPHIGGFFQRMAAGGLSGFATLFGAKAAPGPDHDAQVAADRAIAPDEAAWLKTKLAAHAESDPLEAALLAFIAEESGQTLA
ncbi:MAG: hypothetical protein ACKVOP_05040 [Sphingomonadaceae bacterium]